MAFDVAETNGKFGRFQCQRGKESSSRGKRKRRVFLCRKTVKVKVKGKAIPASFLEIEGKRTFVGTKEGWLVELVGDQNPGPEAERVREDGARRCQGRSNCQRSDGEK